MNDNQTSIQKYNDLLDKHGDSPRSLSWTKDKEYLRFEILCSSFDLEGSTIYDFGCGIGYLYAFLKLKVRNFHYIGVDINENLLGLARKKFPEAKFLCIDLLNNDPEIRPDFIFSSGVHNIKRRDNEEFNRVTFARFHHLAKKGYAINFLSDKVEYKSEESYHHSPEEVLSITYAHTRRIILRNDYAPFEFTVSVSKNDTFNENSVFEEFNRFIEPVENWIK